MQHTISITLAFALCAGLAAAAEHPHPHPQMHADVTCKQRYGGTLAITKGPTEAAHVVTLGHAKQDPLTTDFAAANHPGPDDVAFYFSQCTTTNSEWMSSDKDTIVGQLVVFTSGNKFVTQWTAEGDGGCVTLAKSDTTTQPRALTVEACATSTADERLSRQWFQADELKRKPGQSYTYIEGHSSPASADGFVTVEQTDKGVVVPLSVSVKDKGKSNTYLVMTDVADAQH